MAHPTGSWSFSPGGRFCFNRGYLNFFEWFVNSDNAGVTFDGEVFTIPSAGFPNIVQYVQIKPDWFPWTSNGYRLNQLVKAYWYVILPSPTEFPNAGLVVRFLWDVSKGWGVQFQKESPTNHEAFVLEQAPSDYWAQPVAPNDV